MRAASIASNGRILNADARGIATCGNLSRLIGLVARSFIHAYMMADQVIKVFRAITEMDRSFSGETEM